MAVVLGVLAVETSYDVAGARVLDRIRGVSVHEAARIMAEAGPGDVLVSETVALLCRGSDLTFDDAGEHELKGVPDRWHLYRVLSS